MLFIIVFVAWEQVVCSTLKNLPIDVVEYPRDLAKNIVQYLIKMVPVLREEKSRELALEFVFLITTSNIADKSGLSKGITMFGIPGTV